MTPQDIAAKPLVERISYILPKLQGMVQRCYVEAILIDPHLLAYIEQEVMERLRDLATEA